MEILLNNQKISAARLSEVSTYAKFKKLAYTTVAAKVYSGALVSIIIGKTTFIIVIKDEVEDFIKWKEEEEKKLEVDLSNY